MPHETLFQTSPPCENRWALASLPLSLMKHEAASGASPRSRLLSFAGWAFVLALLVRLGLVAMVLATEKSVSPAEMFWTADTERYLHLADSLLRGEFAIAGRPEIYRLPGYPLLLSPGVAMGWPTVWALVIQTFVCGLLSVAVVYLGQILDLDDRALRMSGLLCAVEPTLLLWSVQLMADSLLALSVAGALVALFLHVRDQDPRMLALATVFSVASAYVKPAAYGFAVVVVICAFAGIRSKERKRLQWTLLVVSSSALLLGAWHARNWQRAGFSGFSTQISQANRSADFAVWRADNARASADEIDRERNRRAIRNPTATDQPLVLRSPVESRIWVHVNGIVRVVTNPGVMTWLPMLDLDASGYASHRELARLGPLGFLWQSATDRPFLVAGSIVLGGLNLAYWSLFILGLKRIIRKAPYFALAVLLTIGYFLLVSGGPWGQSRFRIPFVAPFCAVAGAAFERRHRLISPEATEA